MPLANRASQLHVVAKSRALTLRRLRRAGGVGGAAARQLQALAHRQAAAQPLTFTYGTTWYSSVIGVPSRWTNKLRFCAEATSFCASSAPSRLLSCSPFNVFTRS